MVSSRLSNVRVVLLRPSHPGNIGAVCRAMVTMGLSELYLVAPGCYPHAKVATMAAGADKRIQPRVTTLEAVLSDAALIIGTSARERHLALPSWSARQAACEALRVAKTQPVVFLFGPENTGLTNEELALCQRHLYIDANPDYTSLNLAQAVQIVVYEVRQALLSQAPDVASKPVVFASQAACQSLYQDMERVMHRIGFLKPNNPRRLIDRLVRLFNRSRLEMTELNILRGIVIAIEKMAKKSGK